MPALTAQTLLRPHYPALDGLRGLAVLSICVAHFANAAWPSLYPIFFWASPSVDLFFVLSGFLITGVLYDNLPYPRFFSTFYIRRALRLLPPFLFVWAALLLLAAFLHPVWDRYHFSFLFCLGNFFMPGGFAGFHTDPSFFYYLAPSGHRFYVTIGHMWTLSQEEQFYFVWPLALYLIPSRRLLLRLCLAGAALTLCLRLFLFFHAAPRLLAADLLYYNPFTRFDSHMIGAALALYLRGGHFADLSLTRLRRQTRLLLFTPLALIAILELTIGLRWPLSHHHPVFSTIGFTLDCVAAAGLLLACIDPRALAQRILGHPLLAPLGRISYSLYLFHFLPIQFFVNQRPRLAEHHLQILIPIVGLTLSYAAAHLSYRLLERPFRRLQSTLAPNPVPKLRA